jgi:phage gp36-like protein
MPAYATVSDLSTRFGETELIRLTTPSGQAMDTVVIEKAEAALADASAMIDTYLRKRYEVPLDIVPAEISRACCILARYDLSLGEDKLPPEQTKATRDETVGWLKLISLGQVLLDLTEVAAGDNSFAQASTRRPVFGRE